MSQNETLSVLAERIAFFLNEGERTQVWSYVKGQDSWSHRIDGPGEAKLYVHISKTRRVRDVNTQAFVETPERVSIGGSFYVGNGGTFVEVYEQKPDGSGWDRTHVPDITVAYARGAQAIVKELKRRYLSEYLRVLALAIQKRDADITFEVQQRKLLTDILQAAGNFQAPREDANGRGYASIHKSDTRYISVDITASNTTADLKLSGITLQEAKHILEYLRSK